MASQSKDAAPLLITEDLYGKHSTEIALHSNAREIISSHFNKRLRIVYIKVVSTVCSNMRTMQSIIILKKRGMHQRNPLQVKNSH
jgi:hypothetical protein